MKKLSKVLSTAIVQALKDLELCMADPDYVINFDQWHRPTSIDSQFTKGGMTICRVCYAGSVMAQTLKVSKNENITPNYFPPDVRKMLNALDAVRRGSISYALTYLDKKVDFEDVNVDQKDFPTFKKQMLEISKMLKKHKL